MASVGAQSLRRGVRSIVGSANARNVPGDGLLHPIAIAAIALLIANDHVFKAIWPGPITGKVSDFAGLVFFPLLLQAIWQLMLAAVRRDSAPTDRQVVAAVIVTGVLFAANKLLPAANEAVSIVMGSGQWLVGQVLGTGPDRVMPVSMALDPTDLVALPSLLVAYAIRPRSRR